MLLPQLSTYLSFSLFLYWTGLSFFTELIYPFVPKLPLLLYWASLSFFTELLSPLYWTGLSYFLPELLSFCTELLSPFLMIWSSLLCLSFSLLLYRASLSFCTELVSSFVLNWSLLLYWASLSFYTELLSFCTDPVSSFLLIWSPILHLSFSLFLYNGYPRYNGGWPSARLFGWSAADWSRPATNKSIS